MPNNTIWPLDPHTKAKHSILRRYLGAYYPKLANTRGRIDFVDGFAGPGVYAGGEPGSLIIALDALAQHPHLPSMGLCRFVFLFIEEDRARFENLERILKSRNDPPNVKFKVRCGTFEEHIGEAFDGLERLRNSGALSQRPSFVMVDPFGVKGLPLALLRQLAAFPKTELLVSFMYEPISRFLDSQQFEQHLDSLFGTSEWRNAKGLAPEAKKAFLSDLYARQLKSIGMEYVRLFEMRDAGNRTEYFLAFATHHLEGLRVIKEAMWQVDKSGGVTFSDFTVPDPGQGTLFESEPNYAQLKILLTKRFGGSHNVPIREINEFVLTETAFLEKHGRDVLRQAEKDAMITVTRPVDKRKNYWNDGTHITFVRPK